MEKPDFKSFLETAFNQPVKNSMEDRKTIIHTGLGGARLAQRQLLEAAGVAPEEAKRQADEMYTKEGMYRVGNGLNFIEYIGEYDPDKPNGLIGIKREGVWYVEHWHNSMLQRRTEVTEERINELRKQEEE